MFSFSGIVITALISIVVLGPKKTVYLACYLGDLIGKIKKYVASVKRELDFAGATAFDNTTSLSKGVFTDTAFNTAFNGNFTAEADRSPLKEKQLKDASVSSQQTNSPNDIKTDTNQKTLNAALNKPDFETRIASIENEITTLKELLKKEADK